MGTIATIEERDSRLDRLRRAMEESHLDALIIAGKGHWWTGRGYFRYLTDFHLWGHDALILRPLVGEPVATLNSSGVSSRVASRGWITDIRPDWDIRIGNSTPIHVDTIRTDYNRAGNSLYCCSLSGWSVK